MQSRARNLGLGLLLGLALLGGASTPARAGVDILNFQLGGIGVFPSGGSSQFFGQAAWTPYIGLGTVGIRGDLGITFLKSAITGSRFLAINTEALLSLGILPAFSLEVGGGLHNWVNNGGADAAFTANAVFSTIAGIDRVYAGYSRFFLGSGVSEFRFGIGFNI